MTPEEFKEARWNIWVDGLVFLLVPIALIPIIAALCK